MVDIRKLCCICNGKLDDIITFEKYPISFSMVSNDKECISEDLIFTECCQCRTIQIKNLIDLKILYDKPHNDNIVGKTWIEHFQEFSCMINKFKKYHDRVLEIGSPTDKIVKYMNDYASWVLMDPNSKPYPDKNVENINSFFSEKSEFISKFDTIIHSHLFEHLYEPKKMLLKMSEILTEDGNIFISIPNLHLYSFDILFLGLHFEHTYLINEINMQYLCNSCELEIVNKQYYKTHSIFYQLKKAKKCENMSLSLLNEFNLGYKLLLLNKIHEMKDMISNINSMINNYKSVYIFGCHSNTQAMLYFGLNSQKIKCILDNDSTKWNKKIYGYHLLCNSPEIIKDEKDVIVICNIGPYANEVKKQLIEINSYIIFI
jgi:2-polyprenyl-3-methyl-5-hydroxy-6-metoxy-1,4-benzoquinol methylase